MHNIVMCPLIIHWYFVIFSQVQRLPAVHPENCLTAYIKENISVRCIRLMNISSCKKQNQRIRWSPLIEAA
jgi:hypothetical protein